jgi:hypothetical protein
MHVVPGFRPASAGFEESAGAEHARKQGHDMSCPYAEGPGGDYSARRVIAGSIRAARHAGTQQAPADTPSSSAITPR